MKNIQQFSPHTAFDVLHRRKAWPSSNPLKSSALDRARTSHRVISLVDVLESVQEVLAVGIVFENGLFFIAARGHMIYCAGVFYAEGTSHGWTIVE